MLTIINGIKNGADSIFESYATGHRSLSSVTIEDITDKEEPKALSSGKAHSLAKAIFYYYSEPMILNYTVDGNITEDLKYFELINSISNFFYFDPAYFKYLSDPFYTDLTEPLRILINKWSNQFHLQFITINRPLQILISQAKYIVQNHINPRLCRCIINNQLGLPEHWIQEGADVNSVLLE